MSSHYTPAPYQLPRHSNKNRRSLVIYFYEFKLYCFNEIMFYSRVTTARERRGCAQIVNAFDHNDYTLIDMLI